MTFDNPTRAELGKLVQSWANDILHHAYYTRIDPRPDNVHWVELDELRRLRGWVRRLRNAENDLGNLFYAQLARENPSAVFLLQKSKQSTMTRFTRPVRKHLATCLDLGFDDSNKSTAIVDATKSLLFGSLCSALFLHQDMFQRERELVEAGHVWLGWADETRAELLAC